MSMSERERILRDWMTVIGLSEKSIDNEIEKLIDKPKKLHFSFTA